MSEPREFETRTTDAELTTEQLANAGKTREMVGEPRAFDDDDDDEPGAEAERVERGGEEPRAQRLFADDETVDLRRSWDEIQVAFVDEPRRSVEQADHLVAATMKRLAEIFAQERQGLESQWDRGDDVSTEDLRVALQRYRAFFTRLLAV
jgi:hypothetical protein